MTITASAPHAILLGDTNIYKLAELAPLLHPPFELVDAYAAVHGNGCGERKPDDATYGTTYSTPRPPKKIDYVFFRPGDDPEPDHLTSDVTVAPINNNSPSSKMKAIGARLLGSNPIPGKSHFSGRDGKLYPSDHLGVFIQFIKM